MAEPYPHLRQPIRLGLLTIPNRIMLTTHGPRLSQGRYLRYIAERAQGGVGLMGFNLGPLGLMQFPFGPGKAYLPHAADLDSVPPHPLTREGGAYYDLLIPGYRAWADAAHAHGAKCIGQLYHSGAAQHSDNFQPVVAPSSVPDEHERHVPHALTGDEIADLVQAYALCARRAVAAGYDGVELHAAHGYLAHQFLSPLFNRRTDLYGGPLANRLRFLVETLAAVRDAVGRDFLVGVRLTGPDLVDGGLTVDEVVQVSQRLQVEGAGYISLAGGSYAGLRHGANLSYVAPATVPQGPNVPVARAVKAAVGIPVIVAGRIVDFDFAEAVIASGEADMVGMVRALIADPRAIFKAFTGQGDRITPCIGGNECHYGRAVACAVNPAAGREAEMELVPAGTSKRILVVGAGPAGLECAAAAQARGHRVMLIDRRRSVGGMLLPLAQASVQAEFGRYVAHMRRQIFALGVDVVLDMEVDVAGVRTLAPDEIVLATGAAWGEMLDTDRPDAVIHALTALEDSGRLGAHVAVVGALDDHLPPLIVADFLARTGRQVTLLGETIAPAPALEAASLVMLVKRLLDAGVSIRQMTKAIAYRDGALLVHNSLNRAPDRIADVDSVVMAGGRVPDISLVRTLRPLGLPVYVIGDALSPRRMLHATLDGARLGRTL